MSSEPKISTLSMPETRVHSRKTMASYGSGKFLVEFYSAAFSILLFKFYETNLQLSSILTGLGIVIYSIWNAINDPIVGYFTIRPTRWAKKYGRRFPWIVFGCFIWVFTLLPIFILPKALIEDP
ncbi:MAG: MFS transporter, partial [Promethearchaeota archaeon]